MRRLEQLGRYKGQVNSAPPAAWRFKTVRCRSENFSPNTKVTCICGVSLNIVKTPRAMPTRRSIPTLTPRLHFSIPEILAIPEDRLQSVLERRTGAGRISTSRSRISGATDRICCPEQSRHCLTNFNRKLCLAIRSVPTDRGGYFVRDAADALGLARRGPAAKPHCRRPGRAGA